MFGNTEAARGSLPQRVVVARVRQLEAARDEEAPGDVRRHSRARSRAGRLEGPAGRWGLLAAGREKIPNEGSRFLVDYQISAEVGEI